MYIYFLQIRYVLIQYFMWTIKKITIYKIYIYLPNKYWQYLQKIFIVSSKNILGKISIVRYDVAL